MELTFRDLSTDAELRELSQLAHNIWREHYTPIIGSKQVEYMLEKMYSIGSLKEQIYNSNNIFIGAFMGSDMAGFLSYSKTGEENYFLHKLYVNTKLFRKKIGSSLFDYFTGRINFKEIRLTVNRQNYKAINFYFRLGFFIEKVTDIDIGNGYFMNDFVMLYRNPQNEQSG